MPYAVWAICKAVEQVGDTLLHLFRWRCATEPALRPFGLLSFSEVGACLSVFHLLR